MPRGGSHGGGRKKGFSAVNAEKAKAFIVAFVGSKLESILNLLYKEAQDGNVQAQKELLDRAYGRPKETVEHTGEVKLAIDV